MTGQQFIGRVRVYTTHAFPDRDPAVFAGYSFPRGGTSALILAGVQPDMIKAHGRWTSQAYQRCFDPVHSQAMRPAATRALSGARQ